MQDEPRNPDENAQAEPTNGTAEENEFEDQPNLITVIQQNPVLINGLPYDEIAAGGDQTEEWI